jgi:DNA-binding Xre family transcriptional regulator
MGDKDIKDYEQGLAKIVNDFIQETKVNYEQPIEIEITNNIGLQLDDYKKRTGVSKGLIAKKLGVSRQRLDAICRANNITLEILIKLIILLGCQFDDLFDYKVK